MLAAFAKEWAGDPMVSINTKTSVVTFNFRRKKKASQ